MSKQRAQRLAELLKKEIADILLKEIKDPRIGFVSVTDIDVSNDLRHASVYVSVLGNEDERQNTMEGLEKATGYIRKLIGERIKIYHTPEIIFKYDSSLEHGIHISHIIDEIKDENENDQQDDRDR
ncbi:MAG TPA: 30S ribosome-binding factor RbfA [Halanaerobiales bacterium]|nr:30S ribosome-binding factor RbfA [Halanaerobiales bacterium]